MIVEPQLREAIRDRIVRRLVPEIERYFQFNVTRMDRYMVSCYEATRGGHFSCHRDNVNAGARHRRFAASINLSSDYEGGTLRQVAPVTKGKRHAFVPFFYGEADAALRMQNYALLRAGEILYTGESDRLFPSIVPDLPDGVAADQPEPAET